MSEYTSGDTKRILDEIIIEMKKETPNWKRLLEDNGLIDRLTSQRDFRSLNSTQLRKFFDEVKSIEYRLQEGDNMESIEADLWKLVPSIKYAAGRNTVPKSFADFITTAVTAVSESSNKKQTFLNFERIFESIVAYHKYKGGK